MNAERPQGSGVKRKPLRSNVLPGSTMVQASMLGICSDYDRKSRDVEIPIDTMDRWTFAKEHDLSVRAMKTLIRAKIRYASQIDFESLLQVKNCGYSTARELEQWKIRVLSRKMS